MPASRPTCAACSASATSPSRSTRSRAGRSRECSRSASGSVAPSWSVTRRIAIRRRAGSASTPRSRTRTTCAGSSRRCWAALPRTGCSTATSRSGAPSRGATSSAQSTTRSTSFASARRSASTRRPARTRTGRRSDGSGAAGPKTPSTAARCSAWSPASRWSSASTTSSTATRTPRHRDLGHPRRAAEPARLREARARAVRQRLAVPAGSGRRLLHLAARCLRRARCRRPRRHRPTKRGSAFS